MDTQSLDEGLNICSVCGMKLTTEGKCEGCNMEPAECSCEQSSNQPSE